MNIGRQAGSLVEYVEIRLTCVSCAKVAGDFGSDEYSFAESCAIEGWRVTRSGNVLCPKCKRVNKRGKS